MKTNSLLLCAATLLTLSFSTTSTTAATTPSSNVDYVILERGLHHRQWARVETTRDAVSGEFVLRTNIVYIEMATGMHYVDPATGKLTESIEQFEAVPGGAIARHGQHFLALSKDLATAGAAQLQTPDGKRLLSNLIGLSFYDASTDQHVLIAEVKSSQGQIVGSNQVVYADAMTDIPCNVRYTYTRGGCEQDIILKDPANLPSPSAYGLNPATTRLVVLTEFLNPPAPVQDIQLPSTNSGPAISDVNLDFGVMQVRAGKAFSLGTNSPASETKIFKQWVQLEGRTFLAEQVRVPDLVKAIAALPAKQGASLKARNRGTVFAADTRRLPKLKPAPEISRAKPMETARVRPPEEGFLLDYSASRSP